MAGDGEVFLRTREFTPRSNLQLPFHQILPGDHFRHRMLHLQARVHLHEVKGIFLQPVGDIGDKFNGACPNIPNRFGRCDGCGPHGLSHRLRHIRRRCFLDHLLMPPLQGAIALEQMHRITMGISENLNFDMARLGEEFLYQYTIIAKGRLSFALRRRQSRRKFACGTHAPHSLATTTSDRLNQDRIANLFRFLRQHIGILPFPMITRYHRHPGLDHQGLCCVFQSHRADRIRGWADKDNTCLCAFLRKPRIFREEAIAGMDRLGPGSARNLKQGVPLQVTLRDFCRADQNSLICHLNMAGIGICLGIDGNRPDAELRRRGHDPAGNLSAVRYEYFFKHRLYILFRLNSVPDGLALFKEGFDPFLPLICCPTACYALRCFLNHILINWTIRDRIDQVF